MILSIRSLLPVIFILSFLVISCTTNQKEQDEDRSSSETEFAIAYNVLIDTATDNYEVFTMEMDGANKQNVTNLPGVEWTYLSVNNKLYFISDLDTCYRCYFLYETNYLGENPRKVYDVRLADSWMGSRKDGRELILRPHSSVDSAFHIITDEGQLVNRLSTGLPYFNDPLFIENGDKVVFRGAQAKFKANSGYLDELYVINDDGTGLEQLTYYPESDTTAQWYNYHAGPPKLHPTENFVSFQSYQNGKSSLFAVDPGNGNQWKLTDIELNEGWHSWSPDGKWLVFDVYDGENNQFNIGLMNWESRDWKILNDSTFRYNQSANFVVKAQ